MNDTPPTNATQPYTPELLAELGSGASPPVSPPAVRVGGGADLPRHTLIRGRFEVLERVRRGGQGVVYRALDRELGNRQCAVKVVFWDGQPGPIATLVREAVLTASLDPTYIVHVYAHDVEPDYAWFAMEWLDGPTLEDRIRAEGRLPWPRALGILGQVLRGLAQAHDRGLLHRDLKPANVIFNRDQSQAKILDLGLACPFDPRTGAAVTPDLGGTLRYLAPESWPRAGAPQALSPRSDVYAGGATLYQALTGRPPYPDVEPSRTWWADDDPLHRAAWERDLSAELPADLDLPGPVRQVLARATARDPAQRYATAEEFLRAVNAAGAPAERPVWRRLPAVAAALVLAAALAAWWGWPRPPLRGEFDVLVRERGGVVLPAPLPLGGPDSLPLRAGDRVEFQAQLAAGAAAHVYIVHIDSTGLVKPVYPDGWDWQRLPPARPKAGVHRWPPGDGRGLELQQSPSGLEALIWLARTKELTAPENAKLQTLLTGPGWSWRQPPPGAAPAAVWWENGLFLTKRGPPATVAAAAADDPVGVTDRAMRRIHDLGLAEFSRAVCYPFAGR
jgi:hypothetical protein